MHSSLNWTAFCQAVGLLPKERAAGLGNVAMDWSTLTNSFDFILLTTDGQWVSAALIPKGTEPVYIEGVLHAAIVQLNIRDGKAVYYAVVPDVLARGEHKFNFGAPFMMPEPEIGVPMPKGLACYTDDGTAVDTDSWFITGVILKESDSPIAKEVARTNLTNLREKLQPDGTLEHEGKKYYLYGLFRKDQNRFSPNRVDAFFSPVKPSAVLVRELAQAM